MKLRQHKREHIERLRWRIKRGRMDELRAQWDRGADLSSALAASMRPVSRAFASIANGFARVAIRPGHRRQSPLRTVTAPAPGTGPLCGTRPTLVIFDELADVLQVSVKAPGGQVSSPEEIAESIASVIALAGDELTKE